MLPLVGRDSELDRLRALLLGAKAGEPALALLEGPAGIGKTRLLEELRRGAARDNVRVLTARGSELEAEFAFGVARQLLEAPLADDATRTRWLAGAAAPVAGLLTPPAGGAGAPQALGDPTFALLHGLYWTVVNAAADGPLLLAVDDLHWCDRPSLRFLAYLVRRLEDLPVLVAATVRTSEAGSDPAMLAELAAAPVTVAVRPQPLTVETVGELAAAVLPGALDDALAAAAHEATGGNPLLLGELLRTLETEGGADADSVRERGAPAVSRAVMVRIGRVGDAGLAVAEAVAVLGDAELPEVAALADHPEAEVADATGHLVRAEILHADTPLRFVHPLVRDAVYLSIPPAVRELRHERAAELRRDLRAPAERVAAQLLLAPRRGQRWAVEALHEAGRSAMSRGGIDAAIGFLRRALEEQLDTPEPGLLVELGMAEALGAAPEAVEHLGAAYEAIGDPAMRAQIAFVLARTLLFTQDPQGAADLARSAAAELPEHMEDERLGLESAALLAVVFGAGTGEDLEALERWRDRPLDTGPGGKMLATIAAFAWALMGGPADGAGRLAADALAGGDLIAVDNGMLSFTAMNVLTVAEHPDALAQWELALADAHARGSLFSVATAHMGLGYDHLRCGDLPGAEEALRAGLSELQLWGGAGDTVTLLLADLCTTLRERGDLAGARAALELVVAGEEVTVAALFATGAEAELLLAEGRTEEALEAALRLDALAGPISAPAWVPWRSIQARALLALGRAEEAVVAVEEELPRARAFGAAGTVGHTLRTLGTALGADGLDVLEEAVRVLDGSRARLESAKAFHAYGSALRRARRPTEAREPLRRALELAEDCGAEPLVAAARAELQASGARPRTSARSGPGALTPSERRVADLAAAGRTNREIAQELFVTPKTVEVHLSAAYRKLEIASRRDLAGALVEA